MSTPLANPGVRVPPPLLFVVGFAAGWLIHARVQPIALIHSPGVAAAALELLGVVILLGGVGLMLWGVVTFRRADTALLPTRPASRLVIAGPYRFTRNPMYSGMTLIYIGGVALLNSLWPLLVLPIVLMLLMRLVIQREERYLTDAFGAEYTAYRAQVGRWF